MSSHISSPRAPQAFAPVARAPPPAAPAFVFAFVFAVARVEAGTPVRGFCFRFCLLAILPLCPDPRPTVVAQQNRTSRRNRHRIHVALNESFWNKQSLFGTVPGSAADISRLTCRGILAPQRVRCYRPTS